MSRLHDTGETFGEGNVTLLMVLGVISYSERMGRALAGALARSPAPRSPGRRARDAAVSVDRQHPIDLAILGIESFGRSVAGLQGSVDRRSRTARARSAARTAPRSLRQVMR